MYATFMDLSPNPEPGGNRLALRGQYTAVYELAGHLSAGDNRADWMRGDREARPGL